MSDLDPAWPAPWVRAVLGTAVLAVLEVEELHGYALTERLAERGLGRPRGDSLYPLLESLQEAEAIEATWQQGERGPSRRTYRLTPVGLDRLREEQTALDRLVTALGARDGQDLGKEGS